jgi:hypothetical protein
MVDLERRDKLESEFLRHVVLELSCIVRLDEYDLF